MVLFHVAYEGTPPEWLGPYTLCWAVVGGIAIVVGSWAVVVEGFRVSLSEGLTLLLLPVFAVPGLLLGALSPKAGPFLRSPVFRGITVLCVIYWFVFMLRYRYTIRWLGLVVLGCMVSAPFALIPGHRIVYR